jgi:hypothetical protein
MSRNVNVLVGVELEDFVEVEVVDYNNRNCNYQMWAHADGTYTLSSRSIAKADVSPQR